MRYDLASTCISAIALQNECMKIPKTLGEKLLRITQMQFYFYQLLTVK